MFDINVSNCLTNGLRVYFPKDIVANEIVIHENRHGTICYAETN